MNGGTVHLHETGDSWHITTDVQDTTHSLTHPALRLGGPILSFVHFLSQFVLFSCEFDNSLGETILEEVHNWTDTSLVETYCDFIISVEVTCASMGNLAMHSLDNL